MIKKERNSNVELMRIISMLFIILWHIYIYGGIKNNARIIKPGVAILFEFLSFVIVVHVNSFVLTTGYFQCESNVKKEKVISLINTTFFYRILFLIIFSLTGLTVITKVEMIDKIFLYDYWFIQIYLLLYIISPIINKLINAISQKEFRRILFVLFIIFSIIPFLTANRTNMSNSGYTLVNFVFLYLIGAYLKKYPMKDSYLFRRISKNSYKLFLLIIFIISLFINYTNYKTLESLSFSNSILNLMYTNYKNVFDAYSNPFVLIQSISYFLLFESFNIKSKLINRISKLVLGVYFIHENGFVREYIYKWLRIDNGIVNRYNFVLYVFSMTIIIFIISALIELIRQILVNIIHNIKISKVIREKFYSFMKSFYIKENANE